MYTIEYYKTKRKKPIVNEDDWVRQKIVDKCWNIKSLTIDREDIEHVLYDEKLLYLPALVAKVRRVSSYSDLTPITILNNNKVNQLLIYEIINCDWMINRDELKEELVTLELARTLCKYMQQYEATSKPYRKRDLEALINYYMDTIMNKDKEEYQSEIEPLRLGKSFIKAKKRTI